MANNFKKRTTLFSWLAVLLVALLIIAQQVYLQSRLRGNAELHRDLHGILAVSLVLSALMLVILLLMMLLVFRPSMRTAERYFGNLRSANRNLRELNQKLQDSHNELREKNEILEEAAQVLDRKNQVIRQSRDELEAQRKLLEDTNEDITQSIRYAKRIQLAIIPEVHLIRESLKEVFVFSKPKDIVSGDFHWFSDRNTEKVLIAADCTGHGVPGALMTMIGSSLINEIVNEKKITNPQKVLHNLDIRIRDILQSKSSEQAAIHDGIDMAVISIDTEAQILRYAAAHNPLLYVQGGEVRRIKGSRFPVGSLQYGTEKHFDLHEISYEKGIPFYIFSDGFQDQIGEESSRKYMTRRFREFILSIHHLPMAAQEAAFREEFKRWRGNATQVDDVLVIGLRL